MNPQFERISEVLKQCCCTCGECNIKPGSASRCLINRVASISSLEDDIEIVRCAKILQRWSKKQLESAGDAWQMLARIFWLDYDLESTLASIRQARQTEPRIRNSTLASIQQVREIARIRNSLLPEPTPVPESWYK